MRARRGRQRDSGVFERLGHVLLEFAVDGVGGRGALESRVDLFVLEQIGIESRELEQARFRGTACRGSGRYVGQYVDGTLRVFEQDLQTVPRTRDSPGSRLREWIFFLCTHLDSRFR